ncbi:MAG: tripartite tricarboxylate transporter TctB family protein [Burkholderiales bacterium]|nr:tripartite tricarboxylate transporter TctB family protein [Burkholderiales bacterium]
MIDRVILACTIVLAIVYLYATTLIPSLEIGDPLGPKAFPDLLGVAMLLAAAMLGFEMWKEKKAGGPAQSADEPPFEWGVIRVLLAVTVWTGVYYASFEAAGYVVATAVYLLALMAWFHRGRWIANAVTAAGFSAFTYWLFVTLDVSLPKGFLPL